MRSLLKNKSGIFLLIGVGILVIAGSMTIIYMLFSSNLFATTLPTETPLPSHTPTLTSTPIPPTPTRTPGAQVVPILTIETPFKPTLTPIPTEVTYFDGPIVIGYSVGGRPMEVYRFGTGERAYMVVGGTHGGYEVNTVHLTEELIEYYKFHPEAIPDGTRLYILRALNVDGLQKP